MSEEPRRPAHSPTDQDPDTPFYDSAAGGWGSLKGVSRIFGESSSSVALRILAKQNKPGGMMCSACAWANPANPHTAEFCGADGLIVTGNFTGDATDPGDVERVGAAVGVPIWVGSGVGPSQLGTLFGHADALIVGSWIKEGGLWSNAPDPARCAEIVAEAERVRR